MHTVCETYLTANVRKCLREEEDLILKANDNSDKTCIINNKCGGNIGRSFCLTAVTILLATLTYR